MFGKHDRKSIIADFNKPNKVQSLLLALPAEIADKLETLPDGMVEPMSLIKALSDYHDDLKLITRH